MDILRLIAVAVLGMALGASCGLNFIHYMHMFQLNSYHADEQFKWIGKNIKDVIMRHVFTIGAILTFIICGETNASTCFIAAAFLFLDIVFSAPKKAKKKLVFTPRVMRMTVTSVILYVLLILLVFLMLGMGYASLAITMCVQILTLVMAMIANLINKPVELMINRHYINDAKRIINGLPDLTVVGLTGSYGKTSTKFYLEKLLGAKYNVLMTPESYNTTMGVVKVVRGQLNATHEIFLCEMGAKNVGEIKEICDIVKPKHGIITSIGPQHLETFKSIDNIIKTKFELADSLPDKDGIIFLNYDNEYIAKHECNKNKVTYSLGGGTDYYADNISVSENGTQFTVHNGNEEKQFATKLIGSHNVQNIVGAIAVANTLGVPFADLVMPVKRLECVPHRLQIIKGTSKTIIDDAFNSNPTGAKAALDTLAVFDGFKILVSPGMVELGEKEYELNKRFGEQAAEICDFVIAVGERQAVPIVDGLKAKGYPEEKTYVAKNLNEALAKVENIKTGGEKKIVLLENDLPDNY